MALKRYPNFADWTSKGRPGTGDLAFFSLAKISPEIEIDIYIYIYIYIFKWSDFGQFQLPEVREKRSKNHYISIFGFQCVAINMEGW
jgi:hypothetical protein